MTRNDTNATAGRIVMLAISLLYLPVAVLGAVALGGLPLNVETISLAAVAVVGLLSVVWGIWV